MGAAHFLLTIRRTHSQGTDVPVVTSIGTASFVLSTNTKSLQVPWTQFLCHLGFCFVAAPNAVGPAVAHNHSLMSVRTCRFSTSFVYDYDVKLILNANLVLYQVQVVMPNAACRERCICGFD